MNRNLHLSIGILFCVVLLGNLLQVATFSFDRQGLSGTVLEEAALQCSASWTFAPDVDASLDLPPVFTACLPQRSEVPLLPSATPQRLAAVSHQSLCTHLSRPPPRALS